MGASDHLSPAQFGIVWAPEEAPRRRELRRVADQEPHVLQPDEPLHTHQMRLLPRHVEYFRNGGTVTGTLPPTPHVTTFEGRTWIDDGHHRIAAARANGVPIEVRRTRLERP